LVPSRLEKYDEIAEEHNDIRFHDLLIKETEKRHSLIQVMLTLLDEKNIALSRIALNSVHNLTLLNLLTAHVTPNYSS